MSFGTSPGPELLAALSEKLTQIRVLQAQALDIVAEMDRRNVANEAGYSGLAAFLMDTIRVSRKAANRMITQAEQISQTLTLTGHVTPAPLPAMREAMHDGVVDLEHLDVVQELLRKVTASGCLTSSEIDVQQIDNLDRPIGNGRCGSRGLAGHGNNHNTRR